MVTVTRQIPVGIVAVKILENDPDRTAFRVTVKPGPGVAYLGTDPNLTVLSGYYCAQGVCVPVQRPNGEQPELAWWMVAANPQTEVTIMEFWQKAPLPKGE